MIKYEDQCCDCDMPCVGCRRKKTPVLMCDDCGDDELELWYGADGKMYCKYCICRHLDKVVIEDAD